mmetsp:Transcript_10376/g.23444  ORF Transcript_10376/g.23444 Transcript_10376/m.23444 type:complete len:185 (-) Transcript_10376:53-607(-)
MMSQMWRPLMMFQLITQLYRVESSSETLAKLCKDRKCDDPEYPLLDFEDGECMCMRHPCWDDKLVNTCRGNKEKPYLHYFFVSNDPVPECSCSAIPHYDSEFITRVRCPNHACDTKEYPVLEFDGPKGCICRSHPCDNIDGKTHVCTDKKFPIRRYLVDHKNNPYCDCVAHLEDPSLDKDTEEL